MSSELGIRQTEACDFGDQEMEWALRGECPFPHLGRLTPVGNGSMRILG